MRLKRTGILTKIVIAVLFLYALVTLVRLNDSKARAEEDLAELRRQEALIAAENDDMDYAINHSDDEDVIRDIARDQGLLEEGGEVYYPE